MTAQAAANISAVISTANNPGIAETPKSLQAVQVSVLPDAGSNQNVVAMSTEKQDQ